MLKELFLAFAIAGSFYANPDLSIKKADVRINHLSRNKVIDFIGTRLANLLWSGHASSGYDPEKNIVFFNIPSQTLIKEFQGIKIGRGLGVKMTFDDSLAHYEQILGGRSDVDDTIPRKLLEPFILVKKLENVKTKEEFDSIVSSYKIFKEPVEVYASNRCFYVKADISHGSGPIIRFTSNLVKTPLEMRFKETKRGIEFDCYNFKWKNMDISAYLSNYR